MCREVTLTGFIRHLGGACTSRMVPSWWRNASAYQIR